MEYKDKLTNEYFTDVDFVMKIIDGGWYSDEQAKTVFNIYLNFCAKWRKNKTLSSSIVFSTTVINMTELIKKRNSKYNYTTNL